MILNWMNIFFLRGMILNLRMKNWMIINKSWLIKPTEKNELRKKLTNWTNQRGFTHQNFFTIFFRRWREAARRLALFFLCLSSGQFQQVMSTFRYFEDVYISYLEKNRWFSSWLLLVGFQGCFFVKLLWGPLSAVMSKNLTWWAPDPVINGVITHINGLITGSLGWNNPTCRGTITPLRTGSFSHLAWWGWQSPLKCLS